MSDLYPRPSRQEIAERVKAITEPAKPAAPRPDGSDVVALFGAHVRARLTVRGWSVEDLAKRTGDQAGNLSQAIRGTKCPLVIAGRIAAALGVPLAEMLVPYSCSTCTGTPPKGFRCLECGTEARAALWAVPAAPSPR